MKSAKKFAKALREKIEALCEKIEGNNFNLQEIRNEVLKIPKRESFLIEIFSWEGRMTNPDMKGVFTSNFVFDDHEVGGSGFPAK